MLVPQLTVVGNLAGPPRLRVTPAGVAVADFRIAATPRSQDRSTGEWSDGETLWFGVTVWRGLAQHCAASLRKGDRVVVTGRLSTRSWTTEAGEQRSSLEVDAATVGLDLTRVTATAVRPATPAPEVADDPWVTAGQVDAETGEVLGDLPPDLAGAVPGHGVPEEGVPGDDVAGAPASAVAA